MAVSPAKRLVKYGFVKKPYASLYDENTNWDTVADDTAAKHAEQEIAEEALMSQGGMLMNTWEPTGYPMPARRLRLIQEAFGLSIEESYFWVLNHLRHDLGFMHIDKITDIFTASENSAFWGQSSQRLGIQQDKVQSYFAAIGKMVKDLFQLVRELRIIDERMELYKSAPKSKSADVTLKGLYIDLVEGGTEKPSSVYGMARQVGFTILPDLFFNTMVYDKEELEHKVAKMEYNNTIKNVLRRKLFAFINWRQHTQKEMENRRTFQIKYLRQHWAVIKMYMSWVKPYLKNIKRLSMSGERAAGPDIVSAFETSTIDIEILAKRMPIKGYHPVVLATFNYATKPTMSYQQEYNRGPVHVGTVTITLRAYAWNAKQIEQYKQMRQEEDMELIGVIDDSVQAAMDALGDDLNKYLEEAGEKLVKPKPVEKKKKRKINTGGAFEPAVAVFKGFGEIFGAVLPTNFSFKNKKSGGGDPGAAKGAATASLFIAYKNFKKAHKMLAW